MGVGEDYGVKKLPKLDLWGYWSHVLINSTIFEAFTSLVSLKHAEVWRSFNLTDKIFTQPFHPHAKLKLYPYIFPYFKKFHPSLLLNKKLTWRFYGLSNKATMFCKFIQHGYETFQNVAPILRSVICSRWMLLQTKDYCKRKGVVLSLCFLWKLLLFIVKRFYNLLYNPTCGLLCLLSYWEYMNSHS